MSRERARCYKGGVQATLAQLVERLIRNFHVLGYAIDSTVGYRVVPSAHSAWRALIESDFESNFRVARGAPHRKTTHQQVREVRPRAESFCMLCYSENLSASSRSALILSFAGEGAKRLRAVAALPPSWWGARSPVTGIRNLELRRPEATILRRGSLSLLSRRFGPVTRIHFD